MPPSDHLDQLLMGDAYSSLTEALGRAQAECRDWRRNTAEERLLAGVIVDALVAAKALAEKLAFDLAHKLHAKDVEREAASIAADVRAANDFNPYSGDAA